MYTHIYIYVYRQMCINRCRDIYIYLHVDKTKINMEPGTQVIFQLKVCRYRCIYRCIYIYMDI